MVQNTSDPRQIVSLTRDSEWISFPGGELEGKRPKSLCPACRQQLQDRCSAGLLKPRRLGGRARAGRDEARAPLCFQCYRAEIDRDRAVKAAGELDTASLERFQTALPFESVNRPRLEMLKAERSTARLAALVTTSGKFADRRRQAQIAARHALQRIMQGSVSKPTPAGTDAREIAAAIHAAELQLPESWLPFVVSR
jgi:hypothetical protein